MAGIQLQNDRIARDRSDILYHLGLDNSMDLHAMCTTILPGGWGGGGGSRGSRLQFGDRAQQRLVNAVTARTPSECSAQSRVAARAFVSVRSPWQCLFTVCVFARLRRSRQPHHPFLSLFLSPSRPGQVRVHGRLC